MFWYQIFRDGPEYEARKRNAVFAPPQLSLKDVHNAVPKHLFNRSTFKSLFYVSRHLAMTYAIYFLATRIDHVIAAMAVYGFGHVWRAVGCVTLWVLYWTLQSLAFAGLWCLGHEAGHNALSPYASVNAVIGLALHSFVLVPYYSWRATHRTHHKFTNNLDRDETFIPPTRKDFKLPDGNIAVKVDYQDILEDAPAFTMFKLVMRQLFGYQLYLIHNRKGNPKCPHGTSHYRPGSLLFKPEDRYAIVVSDILVGAMALVLVSYIRRNGWSSAGKLYFVPWLLANNWIVTFAYLQHSDPTIPYYRLNEWTFARGALATVDRPLLGWIGRFFLHNISHDHVAHHFFSMIPFYNLPKVTEAIKPVLGEYYNYDSTNTFVSLWRSFRQCTFVETEGDIIFFKNQQGEAVREGRTSVGVHSRMSTGPLKDR